MLCPLWTETWTFMQHCTSLDFVHAPRQLPNIDGQPPSQSRQQLHICLQEIGRKLHPQTGEEVLPLTWSDIVFTTIDMATIAVVAAFTVVAVFTRDRLKDTITSLLGTQVITSFILD